MSDRGVKGGAVSTGVLALGEPFGVAVGETVATVFPTSTVALARDVAMAATCADTLALGAMSAGRCEGKAGVCATVSRFDRAV